MAKRHACPALLALLAGLAPGQRAFADDGPAGHVRFATFNIAMGLEARGELDRRLRAGDDPGLRKVAAIIQRVRPDVLLLNEFDWFELDSVMLFITRYLDKPQFGNEPVHYPFALNGAVNSGEDSGLDLNQNGAFGEAEDAWGFGRFPGQFGMAVLSRFPLRLERSFRFFKWRDMPAARVPLQADGANWYTDENYRALRLSSKSHWDIAVETGSGNIHFLVSHPTPPVFDGPEDRNGSRNHDEIRLWADYVEPSRSAYIYDDTGLSGGLPGNSRFVIAGDLNADPADGDSGAAAILQLLDHPRVNAACTPQSAGALQDSLQQGGKNRQQQGDPASDTSDFEDRYAGNMRVDYVLPSANLEVAACGVFWPVDGEAGRELIDVSDHRLVWVDIVTRP